MVLDARYRTDSTWNPKALSPGAVVSLLFGNTVAAQRLPRHAIDRFALIAERATGLHSNRGEADLVAEWAFSAIKG